MIKSAYEVKGALVMEKESLLKKIGFLRGGWWLIHLIGIAWADFFIGKALYELYLGEN